MIPLALGLDSSTQSLTAEVRAVDTGERAWSASLDYRTDSRLSGFGIDDEYLVPPRVEGEADQPPLMFLASLDAIFADMPHEIAENLIVANVSGQQHGHVYLNFSANELFSQLKGANPEKNLVQMLGGAFSYGTSPIWKTSNTFDQAAQIRHSVGGKEEMIELSGSDSPLRFTGSVIRRVGQQFPDVYQNTDLIQLISSFIPAVLTGNVSVPIDWGNGAGMSLMNYTRKEWSKKLRRAVATGLPGGIEGLKNKLPDLVSPTEQVGHMAGYFAAKHGVSPNCIVLAGSGDNPQTKVLVEGDLLSLGTSFVYMVSTDGKTVDSTGAANAMYDGVGRPFMFGCRTNGAMVWDKVRALHDCAKEDYDRGEKALASIAPGTRYMIFWQPDDESLPVSGKFDKTKITYQVAPGNKEEAFALDFNGIVNTSLMSMYRHSRGFSKDTKDPLYVSGGAAESPEITRRIAAIFRRPVVVIGKVGAALGAAAAGTFYRRPHSSVEDISASMLPRSDPIMPREDDIKAYHGENGLYKEFKVEEDRFIKAHPLG